MTDSRPLTWPAALGLGLGLLALLIAATLPFRDDLDPATIALLLLLPGIVTGLGGRRSAAVGVALASALAFNVGYLDPYGTLKVDVADEIVDLIVFTGVALLTAVLVVRERERSQAAEERLQRIESLDRENEAIRDEQRRLEAEAIALGMAAEHRAALLRSVSHDLRTPLAAIGAVVSDLRDGTVTDRENQAELLDLVAEETDRLDRLVANLLSMSRVEAGVLEPQRQAIPLEELFADCVRRHARLVEDRKVNFDVPLTLPLVDADWTLVDQVLTNLLANAVRYAPPGSRIDVAARRAGDGFVEVSVSDQGPGIPEDQREGVTEPFRRGPGSTSSGLGLAIARGVAEAHGGSLVIGESGSGGARISFTLPVHGAGRATRPPPEVVADGPPV